MKILGEFYDLLKSRISISSIISSHVALKRKAGEYIGLCPFHSEKSPSFTVNDAKRFYHCFGCGAHGDVIKFVSDISGLSYKDSAIKLANDCGIELPKLNKQHAKLYEETEQIIEVLQLAKDFFVSSITKDVTTYLKSRDITTSAIKDFEIGFAPNTKALQKFFDGKSIPLMMLEKAGLVGKNDDGNIYSVFRDRIMFPIKNSYSKVIGFGGRTITGSMPKYLNSPETIVFKKGEVLYGENTAISAACKKNYVIVVEGYLDLIALNICGFKETVATLGTAVTVAHIQKLWNVSDEIVICLDGDEAGIRAQKRLIDTALPLISSNKRISFMQLPTGSDPDNIVLRDNSGTFQKLLDERLNLSGFIWHTEYLNTNPHSPELRAQLEVKLNNYSKQINDKVLAASYRSFFKNQLWSNLTKQSQHTNNISTQKQGNANSTYDLQSINYSEIEIIEYSLCAILIHFPIIICDESVKNFVLGMDFTILILKDFVEWLIDIVTVTGIGNCDICAISNVAKDTRFYDTFLLLSDTKLGFLSSIEFYHKIDNADPLLLFEILRKQHQLSSLKLEYVSVLSSQNDDVLTKAMLYKTEIQRTSLELQKLNASFFND